MKDFKSVRRDGNASTGENATTQEEKERLLGEARAQLAAFDGKSEDAVLKEIVRRAEEGKRNGTLTNAQIDEFYARFSPLLDERQKKKIAKVIERIKSL